MSDRQGMRCSVTVPRLGGRTPRMAALGEMAQYSSTWWLTTAAATPQPLRQCLTVQFQSLRCLNTMPDAVVRGSTAGNGCFSSEL